jgi:hypothetical protein
VLFRVNQGVAERPFILVEAQRESTVVFDAGAIAGVRATAEYEVFGAQELTFTSAKRLARARIDSVHESRAFGHVVESDGSSARSGTTLPAGARAVLALVPLGAHAVDNIAVFIDRSAGDVDSLVRGMPAVRVVDSASAEATITRRRGVLEVVYQGVALPPVTADTPWTVATRDTMVSVYRGQRLTRVARRDTIAGYPAGRLCAALTRAYAISAFRSIQPPQPNGDIAIHARFVPFARGTPADTVAREDTTYVGRAYDLYIMVSVPPELAPNSTLYMTAALEGYISRPIVAWPPRGTSGSLKDRLNRWIKIADSVVASPPAGSEQLKVVVNDSPYDFRSLATTFDQCGRRREQGTRGDPGELGRPARARGWQATSRRILTLPLPATH